jgi:hypothetical protein
MKLAGVKNGGYGRATLPNTKVSDILSAMELSGLGHYTLCNKRGKPSIIYYPEADINFQ